MIEPFICSGNAAYYQITLTTCLHYLLLLLVLLVVVVMVVVVVCSSSVTGFCRDAVYSLTTDYNNGALRCECSPDGSVSFNCQQFGGQCRCKPNVIGRTCSHCRTGYFGFPDCRRTIITSRLRS